MDNTQYIIEEYKKGKSISALQRELQIPYRHIQTTLIENQITIRGGRKKKELTLEQIEYLKKAFYEGVSQAEISKHLKISAETLRNFIGEFKLQRRNTNTVNKRILSDYFSIIDSPTKAYWLGFLFTDGSVDKKENRKGRIRLQLQEADKEILEKLQQDLLLDGVISKDERSNSICYSVEFSDDQIFNDLGQYGIIPRKTYETTHIPYELIPEKYLKDFARGLFDGDGCLTFSKDYLDVTLHFTSYHESIVKDFQTIIDKLINKSEHNKPFFTSAWHVQWRGRQQVLAILHILYDDVERKLNRKYNKYIELLKSIN